MMILQDLTVLVINFICLVLYLKHFRSRIYYEFSWYLTHIFFKILYLFGIKNHWKVSLTSWAANLKTGNCQGVLHHLKNVKEVWENNKNQGILDHAEQMSHKLFLAQFQILAFTE